MKCVVIIFLESYTHTHTHTHCGKVFCRGSGWTAFEPDPVQKRYLVVVKENAPTVSKQNNSNAAGGKYLAMEMTHPITIYIVCLLSLFFSYKKKKNSK
jgi:hypothetical protein